MCWVELAFHLSLQVGNMSNLTITSFFGYELPILQNWVFAPSPLLEKKLHHFQQCFKLWLKLSQVLTYSQKNLALFSSQTVLYSLTSKHAISCLFIFACPGSALGTPYISSITVEKWNKTRSHQWKLCYLSASWLLQLPFEVSFSFPHTIYWSYYTFEKLLLQVLSLSYLVTFKMIFLNSFFQPTWQESYLGTEF